MNDRVFRSISTGVTLIVKCSSNILVSFFVFGFICGLIISFATCHQSAIKPLSKRLNATFMLSNPCGDFQARFEKIGG